MLSKQMRIQGITIPDDKQLEFALTAIYGVGRSRAKTILAKVGIDSTTKPTDLSADDENKIREEIERFKIEGELKREVSSNVKRMKDIGSYKGSRHSKKLPVRGQRTKTNSRTVRGNLRKTMGSGRTKVDKK
jgi:small subunit ribosomal protein S13